MTEDYPDKKQGEGKHLFEESSESKQEEKVA